jgi:hypothetical protein
MELELANEELVALRRAKLRALLEAEYTGSAPASPPVQLHIPNTHKAKIRAAFETQTNTQVFFSLFTRDHTAPCAGSRQSSATSLGWPSWSITDMSTVLKV